ncbi:carboxypeptidase regulatory-like domain-containing protein [Nakamurella lactea]|uniref:carboxypeptidase regulatory-like domain-containing protein n=1 Tax=Nakamurella lactea TaxID=459515 RepID=UPI0012B5B60C|nr:carboxypeptidase regulatory-like domain-containing protein [Nakamurella lactea]
MSRTRRPAIGVALAVLVMLAGLVSAVPAAAAASSAAGLGTVTAESPTSPQPPATSTSPDASTGSGADETPGYVKHSDHPRYQPAGCATLTAQQRASAIPVARCFAVAYTSPAGARIAQADGPPTGALGPADIQDAYQLPAGGEGQTVAIVVAGGYAAAEADLAVFRSHYGLPACTVSNGCFRQIDQRGGTDYPADDPDWSVEAALDLDAVSSACPKCTLLLVNGDSASLDDLAEAVNTAAGLGVTVVSNSYGIDGETPAQLDYDQYYDHPGTAIVVSSGDTGNVQSFPATSPTVLSVGGTSLHRDGSERGWAESVWGSASGGDGAGSGCSLYESQPAWQQTVDTGCGQRSATADIAADADPETGLAVYNSTGWGGWAQFGGTSLAAPLMSGMYALAGRPTPNTYPASYPYANPNALNDVTTGANGPCGTLLCQAGPGWDGPTGLGTPNGIAALTQGEVGEIAGSVTDSTGAPLAGVTVTAAPADGGSFTATSGTDGSYLLTAPVGSYTLTARLFGYAERTTDVQLTVNGASADFALPKLASRTVSGTVSDGSGHGWPLRARITVDADPGGAVYSDPYTGRYSIELPTGAAYTLHAVAADLPGYQTVDVPANLTGTPVNSLPIQGPRGTKAAGATPARAGAPTANRTDIDLPVDALSCTTPGYAYRYAGESTDFTGWAGQPGAGWSVTDDAGTGKVWAFDDLGGKGNRTGGSGGFAIVDDWYFPAAHDTSLISPVADLSDIEHPEIGFQTDYSAWGNSVAQVSLSLDQGASWTPVWEQSTQSIQGHVSIPIPQAAGKAAVQARFRYVGQYDNWWQLDDVYLGSRSCDPVPGGLVAGTVVDHNTGEALDGVTVSSGAPAGDFGVSAPTADDPQLPDGFYWLYSSHTGGTELSAAYGKYRTATAGVTVPADSVVRSDFQLHAGRLTVSAGSISITERLGAAKSKVLTFGNTGTEPVQVDLAERDLGVTPMISSTGVGTGTAAGAPTSRLTVPVSYRPLSGVGVGTEMPSGSPGLTADGVPTRPAVGAAGDAWQPIANFPTRIMDNAVAALGATVYSVGGTAGAGPVASGYRFDPAAQQWAAIADLPGPREAAQGELIGAKLYVAGGWDDAGKSTETTYAYDPGTDSWAVLADLPQPLTAGASAVLGGKMYVVGGCGDNCDGESAAVYSYDPAADSWTRRADYPKPVVFESCAGVVDRLVCAGGVDVESSTEYAETYVYDPESDAWTQGADLPATVAGAAASASGGRLQMVGGVIGGLVSNQAFEYDPAADSWADLPNATNALYRGGGVCGLYRVGGAPQQLDATPFAEQLPGYDCAAADEVGWLQPANNSLVVAPGRTVKVRVTLDSTAVAQPGAYRADLEVQTDTPYRLDPIGVALQVNPPARWGNLTGTVTDTAGKPIGGVTVEVCTMYTKNSCGPVSYTLTTDSTGEYRLWLDKGYSPVSVIAAKDGYKPQVKVVKIRKGETSTQNFALIKR